MPEAQQPGAADVDPPRPRGDSDDFFANACVPLHRAAADGTILDANQAELDLLGYRRDEYVGRNLREFNVDQSAVDDMLGRLARGEAVERQPARLRCRDGSIREVLLGANAQIVHDGVDDGIHGRVAQTRCVTFDVGPAATTHEPRPHDGEPSYRRLAQLLPVGVYTCSAPTGAITYFNAQAERLWGRAPAIGDGGERFCGSLQLFQPDGTPLPHDECPVAVALRDGTRFRNQEVVVRRPDGSSVPVLVNIDPILDADGRIVGAVNVFHDVSALKDTEQALREQKDNLQTLLETLPVAVLIAHDRDCSRMSANAAAAELLRMPHDANFSMTAPAGQRPTHFRVLRDGREVPPDQLPIQRAARGESVPGEELDNVYDDGTVEHTIVSARPLFDEHGAPRGAVACMLDITRHKNAERALLDADRRKNEFLATLSHELRNPLAPMSTALIMLDRCRDEPVRYERAKAIVERQLAHLVRLVDDLLDVARISRGKIKLRKETLSLESVVQQALETSRPLDQHRQAPIEVALPPEPLWVDADPVRLSQVLGNLLSNASKHTGEHGTIRLTAQRDGGDVVVSVRDSGNGIPADKLDSIFEMFSQIEPPEGSAGGLGIGLSLAKRLVEMHGGSIEARSDGPGHGSEFVLRLPLAATAEDAGAIDAAAPTDGAAAGNGASTIDGAASSNGASTIDAAGTTQAAAAGGRRIRRRILIVDDNVDAAETLAMLLDAEGHETRIAHDGPDALDVAEPFRPAVVLLDIGLPRLSGDKVCRTLREKPWGRDIVIAALTGWGQDEDRRRSADAGFDAHLVKPVTAEALRELIEPGWRLQTGETGTPEKLRA